MPVLEKRKDKYIYPAVFYYEEDERISVLFPNFPGCATQGDNEEEALKNAKEALSGHILMMEQDNDKIPEPTSLFKVQPDTDCLSRIILVEIYMVGLREAWEVKSINRTVTLPRWLDKIACEQSVNFSQTLQEALKQKIKV
jgi:predicted RNase H-like HicB family nuclease